MKNIDACNNGECCKGITGTNYSQRKIFLALHRPDERVLEGRLFGEEYISALQESFTGKELIEILESCGLKLNDVHITNLFKKVLHRNQKPSKQDYQECFSCFKREIKKLDPSKIIVFGKEHFRIFLSSEEITPLRDYKSYWFKKFNYEDIPVLLSPHPMRIRLFDKIRKQTAYSQIKDFLK